MLKKIFWVSLGLFILSLIFLGIYEFAFKNNPNNPVADPDKRAAQADTVPEADTTRPLAFENFLSETLAFPKPDRNALYFYSERDQELKRMSYDRSETTVLARGFSGSVKRVVWAPNFTGALLLIEKDGKSLWNQLDFRNQSFSVLKPEMSRLAWNNLGDSIFYLFTDPSTGNRSLDMASYNGSNWKKLVDLGRGDYFVTAVPQSSQIAFWNRPNGLEESQLETIAVTGENRKLIMPGRFGGDFLWSPNGRQVIVGGVKAKGSHMPTIGVVDDDGKNFRDLNLPTLVSKITWSSDNQTLYYALPGAFPSGTILPNDYFAKPVTTTDTFWKMNIKTGKRERLVPLKEMQQTFDATDIFLSADETSLFFVDRTSHKLYRISL